MKDLGKKYYGIDGVDGSGKDYFIENVFSGYKIIKAGGAGLNKYGKFEFSENILQTQYNEVFENLDKDLALNRTFISFLVGKIIDKEYFYNELFRKYEVLKESYKVKGLVNLVIERDIEQIKEVLIRRKVEDGELSSYEQRLLDSQTLLGNQQSLYREIGEKIGAKIINNDGTEKFLNFNLN